MQCASAADSTSCAMACASPSAPPSGSTDAAPAPPDAGGAPCDGDALVKVLVEGTSAVIGLLATDPVCGTCLLGCASAADSTSCAMACTEVKNAEVEQLICNERDMADNTARFVAACPEGSACVGACKQAFDAAYAGCVRGFVPLIFDGGFANATLKRILDQCVPQSGRRTALPLKIDVALAHEKKDPVIVAAVQWAIRTAQADPQLLAGYDLQVEHGPVPVFG